jgi:uncharacterized lipoprotein YehR (DUF1307 family)
MNQIEVSKLLSKIKSSSIMSKSLVECDNIQKLNTFSTNSTGSQIKISELFSTSLIKDTDLLVVVDNDLKITHKIAFQDFMLNLDIDGGDIGL